MYVHYTYKESIDNYKGIIDMQLQDDYYVYRYVSKGRRKSFRVKDIWAINNQPNNVQCGISISRELEDIYSPGDVRTMLFRRLYMMLDIEDSFSDKTTGNVVISYHQDGIEFAFGDNVKVCQNLCI